MIRALLLRIMLLLALLASPAMAQTADPDASAALGMAVQAKTLAIGRDPAMVISLGDSRRAADFLDATHRAYGNRSQLNVANALLDQRLVIDDTLGVSGDRTDQILARVDAAIASGAGILYYQGGVNNIGAVASGNPAYTYTHAVTGEVVTINTVAAVAARDIIQACERARLAGMKIVLEQEVGSQSVNTAEKLAALMDLRAYIADYARRTPNVYLHDATAIVMQPGSMAFKLGLAYDLTHVNARGAYLWGKSDAQIFGQLVPPMASPLIRNAIEVPANGRRQLLTNPIFATATGGTLGTSAVTATTDGTTKLTVTGPSTAVLPIGAVVSGAGIPAGTTITAQPAGAGLGAYTMSAAATASASGVAVTVAPLTGTAPASWTATATGQVTATLGTTTDAVGLGNNVTMAIAFAGAGSLVRLDQSFNGTQAGAYASTIQAGDLVEAVAKIEVVDSPAVLAAAYISMSVNQGGGAVSLDSSDMAGPGDSANVGINEPTVMTLRTRPFRIPAATGAYPFVIVSVRFVGSGAGTANVKVHQVALRRIQ